MEKKKILYITQEITPYLPDSTTAVFSKRILDVALQEGYEFRVFTPRFGLINERRNQLHDVIRLSGSNIIINDTDHPLIVKVASMPTTRTQVYFVDNPEFFKRKTRYGNDPKFLSSNTERAIFFIRGVMEAIRKLRWIPDIVHCIGWFSSFTPLYLRNMYKEDPCLGKAKILFSTALDDEEGKLGENISEVLNFDINESSLIDNLIKNPTIKELRKMALSMSDGFHFIKSEKSNNEENEYLKEAEQLGKPFIQTSSTSFGKELLDFCDSI